MQCLNVTKMLKRSLYASVFVSLMGCQPEESNTSKTDTSTPSSLMPAEKDSPVQPLLTLDELLNASDFQAGIKQSVLNDDSAALKDWQEQLLAVAKEVHLASSDVKRISGQQGLLFIEFEAKKQLFNDEFIELFMTFQSIDELIQKYPYLTGVHKRAQSLIDARDLAIERAATMLSEEGIKGDAIQQARTQWQDYMINSGRLETLRN
jgi:hypothetical protein